ncbi:hypothetical protein KL935_005316 [Ogataea polymorpha]|uniref:uncharacterized protein n=1 Tax=Ogataea polymorpha TaxID=460523 RepID=UPI0007F392A7|nr:uncharacterized protein OGAPODRAFT_102504 [Ogataea polymorpha]KAG7887741.1 hypothetical protein KL908_005392 [Ogataea polymorpha]KAG7897245.1 hypothetical protein KL935_005316 [Ogataea polymorpha]KAG7898185.1 hypothetical protein KL907_005381 [Ogataea polymorpha]KAG7926983.1 hypothetical protein KL934_005319 [Ogataea polymorpha]OBA14410.1 hypothetical protein OGAPODRAFT_102504 [Ogataea polymorpha]
MLRSYTSYTGLKTWALDWILFATVVYHLLISPYTKVEESFNLHAVHDLINYGIYDVPHFDHKEFPGAVKRSFVGSLMIFIVSKPLLTIVDILDAWIPSSSFYHKDTQLVRQITVRFALGLVNLITFIKLRGAIFKSVRLSVHGERIQLWFSILQFSQFHFFYYASRTLPNFVAMPMVSTGISWILQGRTTSGICIIMATGIILRTEILAFGILIYIIAIALRELKLRNTFPKLLATSISASVVTMLVDTYFWQEPSFPELESFYFNVIEGKSAQWGTEPFHSYLTKYVPKLFILPVVPCLAFFGLFVPSYHSTKAKIIIFSSWAYILLMSIQPHKEWRFIIYSSPGILLSASCFLAKIEPRTRLLKSIMFTLVCLVILVSYILSIFAGFVSSFNYPGGYALQLLNDRLSTVVNSYPNSDPIMIHLNVKSRMTGASLFGEIRSNSLIYDKTEDEMKLNDKRFWQQFSYVISDCAFESCSFSPFENDTWSIIDTVEGYHGFDKQRLVDDLGLFLRTPAGSISFITQIVKSHNLQFIYDLSKRYIVLYPTLCIYRKTGIDSTSDLMAAKSS